MTGAIRVLLVDDQPLFRRGLRMLIDSQPDLEVVGEAGDGAAAAVAASEHEPDVVLMDIRMPGVDGIAGTASILNGADERDRRRPRVIVLTTFDLDDAALRAIRAGASGFLLKDAEPEFLLAAIRAVHGGHAVVAPGAIGDLLAHVDGATAGRTGAASTASAVAGAATAAEAEARALSALSAREREIFRAIALGLSNAEIASREFVSEATVKSHVGRILAKLGLRDRVQVVLYAHDHGLLRR